MASGGRRRGTWGRRRRATRSSSRVSKASAIVLLLRCLSKSAGFSLFCFCNLAEGTRDSFAPLEGSQSGIEREGEGGKIGFCFLTRSALPSKTRRKKSENSFLFFLNLSPPSLNLPCYTPHSQPLPLANASSSASSAARLAAAASVALSAASSGRT